MKILILSLCFIGTAFTQVPNISISNLNLNYSDPSGVASATEFKVPGYTFSDSPNFEVEQQAGEFILSAEDQSFRISSVPAEILALEKLLVESFSLSTNMTKLRFTLAKLSGNNSETSIMAQNVLVNCKYEKSLTGILDEVMHSCVNNDGQIKIASFIKNGKEVIANADLVFKDNNLVFKIKAAGFNVNGSGKAYYTPGLLRIKIEKAKVGVLNIKKKLFAELEKNQSDNIKVSNPWIEISL